MSCHTVRMRRATATFNPAWCLASCNYNTQLERILENIPPEKLGSKWRLTTQSTWPQVRISSG